MADIVIPSIGIGMEEAMIVTWLKQPGDTVAPDEPIVEIETDKATTELTSPAAGTLGPHLAEPGAVVAVGTTIVRVLDGSEAQAGPAAASPAPQEPAPALAASAARAAQAPTAGQASPAEQAPPGARTPHRLSPRARRQAALAAAAPAAAPAAPAAASDGRFRALIATKVAESWREIPHFMVSRDVDAGSMQAALADARERPLDPAPTLTDLMLRALALALRANGEPGEVDVGLAVATGHGVVIPVVRAVLGQELGGLAAARAAAVERARSGRLAQDDLADPPRSTLSNLGMFGVDRFTGVIALGQASLLTVGRVAPRVVADERHAISVRPIFTATLNADHRTLDGADAARLLGAFVDAAENMGSQRQERT